MTVLMIIKLRINGINYHNELTEDVDVKKPDRATPAHKITGSTVRLS